jgi:hypothetical protein
LISQSRGLGDVYKRQLVLFKYSRHNSKKYNKYNSNLVEM